VPTIKINHVAKQDGHAPYYVRERARCRDGIVNFFGQTSQVITQYLIEAG
jgi:hypothetical protein